MDFWPVSFGFLFDADSGICWAYVLVLVVAVIVTLRWHLHVERKKADAEIAIQEEYEQRIRDRDERVKDRFDLLFRKIERLVAAPEYRFVEQFAKKFHGNRNLDELSKLQIVLESRGFEFSYEEMDTVVGYAVGQQRCRNAKIKILNEQPDGAREIIETYLNFYQADDYAMLEVLKEILEEKGLFTSFRDSHRALAVEAQKIQNELELENFERRLLDDDVQVISLTNLDNMSGYEFEAFLRDLFTNMGFSVEQTRLSGDQGADLVAVKFGEKMVIQAKRYGGKVGNYAVQEIMAAISLYGAQKGMVITNSYFTSSAKELAKANNIEMIDRDGLEKLINQHW